MRTQVPQTYKSSRQEVQHMIGIIRDPPPAPHLQCYKQKGASSITISMREDIILENYCLFPYGCLFVRRSLQTTG